MPRHVSRLCVRLYDLNTFGEVPSPVWLRILWQAATDASAAAGFDLDWYERQGTIWLIRRTVLESFEPAVYRDEIAVTTWVSDIRRVRSQRQYEIRRVRDGRPLVRAATDWVYIDLVRGKPVRVPVELEQGLMPEGVTARDRPPRAATEPGPRAFTTRRRVEFAALDTMAHVNNAYYMTWVEQDLLDALAAHGWRIEPLARPARLRAGRHDIEYFEAALYGDELTGVVWVTRVDAGGFTCEHALYRNDRRLLHVASDWEWQGEPMPLSLRQAAAALSPEVRPLAD